MEIKMLFFFSCKIRNVYFLFYLQLHLESILAKINLAFVNKVLLEAAG